MTTFSILYTTNARDIFFLIIIITFQSSTSSAALFLKYQNASKMQINHGPYVVRPRHKTKEDLGYMEVTLSIAIRPLKIKEI